MQPQRAALGQREGAQVVDQPREQVGFLEDCREMDLVGRVDAVDEPFEVPLDHGKRGA